jgi:hypothetical protein
MLVKLFFILDINLVKFINNKNKDNYMKIEYIKENYKFETLTAEHDLSEFDSDSKDLNDFLKNDALKQQRNKLNLTKLITCDEKIIGYVTLLTESIPLKDIRDDKVKKDIKINCLLLQKVKEYLR